MQCGEIACVRRGCILLALLTSWILQLFSTSIVPAKTICTDRWQNRVYWFRVHLIVYCNVLLSMDSVLWILCVTSGQAYTCQQGHPSSRRLSGEPWAPAVLCTIWLDQPLRALGTIPFFPISGAMRLEQVILVVQSWLTAKWRPHNTPPQEGMLWSDRSRPLGGTLICCLDGNAEVTGGSDVWWGIWYCKSLDVPLKWVAVLGTTLFDTDHRWVWGWLPSISSIP